VIGVPDEYSGDIPLAFVVLEHGAAARAAKDEQEREHLRQSIAKVSPRLLMATFLVRAR
jgi:4-coumarate--CoA ligase